MFRPVLLAGFVRSASASLALATALSACGGEQGGARPPGAPDDGVGLAANATAPALASKPAPGIAEGLDLPEVGTIGDLPPEPSRVVVRIDREGALSVDGVPTREEEAAGRAAKRRGGRERLDVLLAVDRTVPWAATARFLGMAAHTLRTDRVEFLVVPEGGGPPGALATFLPGSHESCCGPEANTDPVRVGVSLREGPATDLRALYAAMRARPSACRDVRVTLVVEALVPTGEALRAVDVLFRAGYSWVGFLTPPTEETQGTIREIVARARAAKGAVHLTLDDSALSAPPAEAPLLPAVARVVGRPAGDWGPMEPPLPAPPGAGAETPIADSELSEQVEPMPEEVGQRAGSPPAPTPAPATARAAVHQSPRRPRSLYKDPVSFALEWLAAHQSPDGRFEAQGFAAWCRGEPWSGPRAGGAGLASRDRATTALALAAFLGAGWTPRSESPYGSVVTRGVRWLLARQDAEGCLGDTSDPLGLRDHAVATLVLAMADRSTYGSASIRPSLVRALAFAAASRNPGGGWGRGVRSGDLDIVTTAWMAAAWTEGRRASDAGVEAKREPIPLDTAALTQAREAVLAATDPRTGRVFGAPDDPRLDAFSPAALAVRRLAGEDAKSDALGGASAWLLEALPTREGGRSFDPLAVWFGTLVAFERGGDLWKAWEPALKVAVISAQTREGEFCEAAGSWDALGPSAADGGRVETTALLALVAEIYFRYDRVPGLAGR